MRTSFSGLTRWKRVLAMAIATGLQVPATALQAQAGSITGRVTDARSEVAVAGAAVTVEGTRLVGVTGADGRYRIGNVPAGTHKLSVQSIGYAVQERSVVVSVGPLTADFSLEAAPIALEQVVVTGTAAGERVRSLGNSVARVNATEAVALGAPQTVQALLNARAPGVAINFTTGGSARARPSTSAVVRA